MKREKPLSYVVCCSHNGEKYIGQQLQSVLDSLDSAKIKLFDFGSTDKTVKLVSERFGESVEIAQFDMAPGARDSFFLALKQLAPDLQPDDLVYVIDQDDVWLPEKGDVVSRAMLDSEVDFFYHNVRVVDHDLKTLRDSFYDKHIYADADFSLAGLRYFNPVVGHTLCVKGRVVKHFVEEMHLYSHFVMHDWALAVFCVLNPQYRSMSCSRVLSLYRQHDSNVLGESRKSVYRKIVKALSSARDATRQFLVLRRKLRKDSRDRVVDAVSAIYLMPFFSRNPVRFSFFLLSVIYSVYLTLGGERLWRKKVKDQTD